MSDAYCFKVRVGVVVLQDERILLVRQNNRDFWVLPGGTLEVGERLDACAVREIKEETNLDIVIEKLLGVSDFVQPKGHTVDVFFLGRYTGGELQMETTENLNEIGFFTYDQFQAMAVQPALAATAIAQAWEKNFKNITGQYWGQSGLL